MIPRASGHLWSNDPGIRAALESFVAAYKTAEGDTVATLRDVALESRYYSSVLRFDAMLSTGKVRRFFAKLPKALRSRGHTSLQARTPTDLELARRENEAHVFLERSWPAGPVRFTSPVHFDERVGCIVFERLDGEDLWRPSLARAIRHQHPPWWSTALKHIGAALATYHVEQAVTGLFDAAPTLKKIDSFLALLKAKSSQLAWNASSRERTVDYVPGIKGFELRNVRLVDQQIWLYDPGRLKQEPAEADAARFVASVRMLAWGTIAFPFANPEDAEKPFLEGYQARRKLNSEVFGLLLQKECLKNWYTGFDITARKTLPRPFTNLLQRFYVGRGHERIVRNASGPLRSL